MTKRNGLNVKMIERLKEPGKYGDGRNLYLHVGPNGSKSWLFIYRRLGSDRMRGLGSYRHVKYAEARATADKYLEMLRQGTEPPKSRGAVQKKDEGRTFALINERYLKEHKDSWRNPEKAAGLWRNSLRDHAYPILAESRAVREAAETVRAETGLTAADPVAAIIAARVVEAMQAYLAEDMDPLLAAMGELQRRACPSPFDALATDAGIDAVALFTEARVNRVRNRCGRSLSVREDEAECRELWATVHAHLWHRYIRALRLRS